VQYGVVPNMAQPHGRDAVLHLGESNRRAGRPATKSSMLPMKLASGIDISCNRRRTSTGPCRQHHIRSARAPTDRQLKPAPLEILSELAPERVTRYTTLTPLPPDAAQYISRMSTGQGGWLER
jgi:hypothetical protein